MKRKYILLAISVFVVVFVVFFLSMTFNVEDAEASLAFGLDQISRESTQDGTVYEYDLYVTITGTSKFNTLEGSLTLTNLDIISIELQNGFQAITSPSDSNGYSFKYMSNTVFDSDDNKVVFARVTAINTSNENCSLTFSLSAPTITETNNVLITKTAVESQSSSTNIEEVEEGDIFWYKIVLTNESEIETDSLELTDSIPNDFEILDTSPTGTVAGDNQTISWSNFTLEASESETFYVQVKVREDSTRLSWSITNTATVTVNDESKSSSVTVDILRPTLTITKSANESIVRPGDQFTYTIVVSNTGKGTAKEVYVTDSIDDNFTIDNTSETNIGTGNNLKFYLGDIGSSDSREITITVTVNSDAQLETIDNVALASASNHETVDDDASVEIVDYNLTITKSVSESEVRPGGQFTYIIVINNTGSVASGEFEVIDEINSKLEILSTDPKATIKDQQVAWKVDSLAKDDSISFEITVKVKDNVEFGTVIDNTAILREYGENDKPYDASITVIDSDITIKKTASQSVVCPGDEFEYNITVTNNGNATSLDLTIFDEINSNLEILSYGDGQKNGQEITWHIGTLDSGATTTVTVKVKVKSDVSNDTTINNVAVVREPGKSDKEDDVAVVVKKPILKITKEASTETVSPGETFTYTITVSNTGEVASNTITITDTIDSLLTILDPAGGSVDNNNMITWTVPSLDSNDFVTYTIKVQLSSSATSNTQIPNTAFLIHDDEKLSDSDTVDVVDADVYLIKTASNSKVYIGEEFYYTITVGNNGSASATSLVLTDEIPENLKLLGIDDYSYSGVTHGITDNKLVIEIDSLDIREPLTFTVRVKVLDTALKDETITNTAILTYDETELRKPASVIVIDSDLTVSKISNKDKVLNTEHFVYTITVTNNGTYKSQAFDVIDIFDENLTIVSCDNCQQSDGNLIWSVESLGVGESVTFTVEAYIDNQEKGYVINNKVVVEEPGKPDKEDEVDIEVVDYNISIIKEVSATKVKLGEEFKYYIRVINNSDIPITNIKISDFLDEDLIIVDDGGLIVSDNTLSWEFTLLSNEEMLFEVTVKVKETSTKTKILNSAILTVDDEDTPSNEVIVQIVGEENPSTGSFINYMLLIVSLVVVSGMIIYTKKYRKIYKI